MAPFEWATNLTRACPWTVGGSQNTHTSMGRTFKLHTESPGTRNVWLNVARDVEHIVWSVRLEKHFVIVQISQNKPELNWMDQLTVTNIRLKH